MAASASLIVSPRTTTTYSLAATGTGGSANASVTVEVLPAQADFMVYETDSGYWGMLDADRVNAVAKYWGGAGYQPVPADFDGDAKNDFALYHEASGCWYVLRSATNFIAGVGAAVLGWSRLHRGSR